MRNTGVRPRGTSIRLQILGCLIMFVVLCVWFLSSRYSQESHGISSSAAELHQPFSFPVSPAPAEKTGLVFNNVYMDWNLPSNYFGYINYKALESNLAIYPEAKFTILLIGPQV